MHFIYVTFSARQAMISHYWWQSLYSVQCSYLHHFPSLIPITHELLIHSATKLNGQEYRSAGPWKSRDLYLIYFHLWSKTVILSESGCFHSEFPLSHFPKEETPTHHISPPCVSVQRLYFQQCTKHYIQHTHKKLNYHILRSSLNILKIDFPII